MRSQIPQQAAIMTCTPKSQVMHTLISMQGKDFLQGQGLASLVLNGVRGMFPQPYADMILQQHRPNSWKNPQGHMHGPVGQSGNQIPRRE